MAVPFEAPGDDLCSTMEIGYIVKKNVILSKMGEIYIDEIKRYLQRYAAEKYYRKNL